MQRMQSSSVGMTRFLPVLLACSAFSRVELTCAQEEGPTEEEAEALLTLEQRAYETAVQENSYWHDQALTCYKSRLYQGVRAVLFEGEGDLLCTSPIFIGIIRIVCFVVHLLSPFLNFVFLAYVWVLHWGAGLYDARMC